MGKHRKIPKKNRRKLKSVDPFNRDARKINEAKSMKQNHPPKLDDIDRQTMSRGLKMFMKSCQDTANTSAEKIGRKHRKRDGLAEASNAAGFKRGKFESESQFLHRVGRRTHYRVQEELLKARFDMAGRDIRDIEADLAALDQSSKRNANTEKIIKNDEKTGETDKFSKRRLKTESEKLHLLDSGGKMAKKRQRRKKNDKKVDSTERDDTIWNAREIIAFGERVDGPPQFDIKNADRLKAGFAKAGSKRLLLASLINESKSTDDDKIVEKSKTKDRSQDLLSDERERVISAYRNLKKAVKKSSQNLTDKL